MHSHLLWKEYRWPATPPPAKSCLVPDKHLLPILPSYCAWRKNVPGNLYLTFFLSIHLSNLDLESHLEVCFWQIYIIFAKYPSLIKMEFLLFLRKIGGPINEYVQAGVQSTLVRFLHTNVMCSTVEMPLLAIHPIFWLCTRVPNGYDKILPWFQSLWTNENTTHSLQNSFLVAATYPLICQIQLTKCGSCYDCVSLNLSPIILAIKCAYCIIS